MEVYYSSENTERLAETAEHRKGDPPSDVITRLQRLVKIIQQLDNLLELRTYKGYRMEKLKGDLAGRRSIRLGEQFRIFFEEKRIEDVKAIIFGEVTKHYD